MGRWNMGVWRRRRQRVGEPTPACGQTSGEGIGLDSFVVSGIGFVGVGDDVNDQGGPRDPMTIGWM